jgi:hypothetical protein
VLGVTSFNLSLKHLLKGLRIAVSHSTPDATYKK